MEKIKNLIIVESPTKAKTISQFLGDDFIVESSNGHVRDLPKSRMGIKIEENFNPEYIIPLEKRKIVNHLKKVAENSKTIFFATDEDREGEAIAWHLAEILKLEKNQKNRIAFHEITKDAVLEALKNPREIDMNLVNAQQARRILDRLVGYSLSPLLWKKIARKLSAGRVQSAALRLIVERQREIENFIPQEYWTIIAQFKTVKGDEFEAVLYKINDKILDKFDIKSETEAKEILKDLEGAKYTIIKIEERETKKSPPPPFITSTLQQEANKRFGYSTKKIMMIAQQLYEGIKLGKEGMVGLITYMRTDSFNLAEKFLIETRKYIKEKFKDSYLPKSFRIYKTRSKLAQEAHEAIRPTSILREPEKIKKFLTREQFRIYELIWRRSLASQMSDAEIKNIKIEILAKKDQGKNYYFKAIGNQIKFDGWLSIYPLKLEETILPLVKENEILNLVKIEPKQHFTQPPSLYSEAGLVKALEKYGIGRPSTYAPIISTLFERNYVRKEKNRLVPTETGIKVNDLLVNHFPEIVDYQFTAEMEEKLDKIAEGKQKWYEMIADFYWPFKKLLERKEKEIVHQKPTEEKTNEVCEKCGKPMVVRISRFGKFLACSGFPECKFVKPIQDETNKLNIKCPKCQKGEIIIKKTKRGKEFYTCSRWPDCDFKSWEKPSKESST